VIARIAALDCLIRIAAVATTNFGAFARTAFPEKRTADVPLRCIAKNVPAGLKRKSGFQRYRNYWKRGKQGMEAIGRTRWVIPEGYIPSESSYSERELVSHETACILNAADRDAHVTLTIFFADREPVGPYRVTVAARRTLHLRFNDLDNPRPVPRDTDYASVFESDVPIIVQHTRLDSRRAEVALLSTVAYPEG
jgi:hypothetical protein